MIRLMNIINPQNKTLPRFSHSGIETFFNFDFFSCTHAFVYGNVKRLQWVKVYGFLNLQLLFP